MFLFIESEVLLRISPYTKHTKVCSVSDNSRMPLDPCGGQIVDFKILRISLSEPLVHVLDLGFYYVDPIYIIDINIPLVYIQ